MGHAETDGARTEPSERNNHGRRFGNGRVIGPRSEVEQVYSSTGTQWDLETAVCYYRHRYYGAELGRFGSRDPLTVESGDENLYRYVGGNPLVSTDPSGLRGHDWDPFPPKDPPTNYNWYCGKCTTEQVEKLLKDIRDIMNRTWVFPFWPGQCGRWAQAFEDNLPPDGFNNPCLKNMGWEPSNAVGGGHAYYWFELDDGTIIKVDCWMYHGGPFMQIIPPPKRKCCPAKE